VELLVVIAIIAMLMAVLLPAIGGARNQAQLVSCAAQQRQVAQALHAYANDHGGHIPRGPDPRPALGGFDFAANDKATNQLWSGERLAVLSLGVLVVGQYVPGAATFCPDDDTDHAGEELPQVGTAEDAYASFYYRQLDHLPAERGAGLLDDLGANVVDDVIVNVEALLFDANALGQGPFRRTNHQAEWVNVTFRDASVRTFRNEDDALVLPPAAFAGGGARIPLYLDQLLTNADYAYRDAPATAPRLPGLAN